MANYRVIVISDASPADETNLAVIVIIISDV
jgi:hypothetical protein